MGREARTKLHKIKLVFFFPLSVCGAMTRFLSRNMTYYSTKRLIVIDPVKSFFPESQT